MKVRKETPYFGGPIPDLTNGDFHYRNGELYWRASYAAKRMQEVYDRGKRDALEKKLNGDSE